MYLYMYLLFIKANVVSPYLNSLNNSNEYLVDANQMSIPAYAFIKRNRNKSLIFLSWSLKYALIKCIFY